MTPFIVVLSAPSGAGKTTIAQALVKRRKDLGFSVSATTRDPRRGEKDGKAYNFVTDERFRELQARGAFVESAQYAGHWYGTLKTEVERVHNLGRHVLLDIEIEGARQVRRAYPREQIVSIFVLPPSPKELMRRLKRRRSESKQSLARRLERAVEELKEAREYDYSVVNNKLTQAVAEVSCIIDAEELRTFRNTDLNEQLAKLSAYLSQQVESLRRERSSKVLT